MRSSVAAHTVQYLVIYSTIPKLPFLSTYAHSKLPHHTFPSSTYPHPSNPYLNCLITHLRPHPEYALYLSLPHHFFSLSLILTLLIPTWSCHITRSLCYFLFVAYPHPNNPYTCNCRIMISSYLKPHPIILFLPYFVSLILPLVVCPEPATSFFLIFSPSSGYGKTLFSAFDFSFYYVYVFQSPQIMDSWCIL